MSIPAFHHPVAGPNMPIPRRGHLRPTLGIFGGRSAPDYRARHVRMPQRALTGMPPHGPQQAGERVYWPPRPVRE